MRNGTAVADGEDVPAGVLVQEPTNTGGVEYGAGVTPRKTVLAGAVARVVAKSPTVLYE